jgi:hypothetical protein
MGEVLPMPTVGDVFTDVRGGGRTMRVSQHADRGVVVVSFWAGELCRSSFRLSIADAARLAALIGEVPGPPGSLPSGSASAPSDAAPGGLGSAPSDAAPGGLPSAPDGGAPSVPAQRAADEDAA